MSKSDKQPKQLFSNVQSAYGNIADCGAYLGAKSHSAAQRRMTDLRAKGLRHFVIAGMKHWRFSDIDVLLDELQDGGFYD